MQYLMIQKKKFQKYFLVGFLIGNQRILLWNFHGLNFL